MGMLWCPNLIHAYLLTIQPENTFPDWAWDVLPWLTLRLIIPWPGSPGSCRTLWWPTITWAILGLLWPDLRRLLPWLYLGTLHYISWQSGLLPNPLMTNHDLTNPWPTLTWPTTTSTLTLPGKLQYISWQSGVLPDHAPYSHLVILLPYKTTHIFLGAKRTFWITLSVPESSQLRQMSVHF